MPTTLCVVSHQDAPDAVKRLANVIIDPDGREDSLLQERAQRLEPGGLLAPIDRCAKCHADSKCDARAGSHSAPPRSAAAGDRPLSECTDRRVIGTYGMKLTGNSGRPGFDVREFTASRRTECTRDGAVVRHASLDGGAGPRIYCLGNAARRYDGKGSLWRLVEIAGAGADWTTHKIEPNATGVSTLIARSLQWLPAIWIAVMVQSTKYRNARIEACARLSRSWFRRVALVATTSLATCSDKGGPTRRRLQRFGREPATNRPPSPPRAQRLR